jgi:hypothetical protein
VQIHERGKIYELLSEKLRAVRPHKLRLRETPVEVKQRIRERMSRLSSFLPRECHALLGFADVQNAMQHVKTE